MASDSDRSHLVSFRPSYSLLLRCREAMSAAEVEADPPDPSELMKEPLSFERGRVSAAATCVVSGSFSRLLDLISFFSFRVIQLPRL